MSNIYFPLTFEGFQEALEIVAEGLVIPDPLYDFCIFIIDRVAEYGDMMMFIDEWRILVEERYRPSS